MTYYEVTKSEFKHVILALIHIFTSFDSLTIKSLTESLHTSQTNQTKQGCLG